jgi:tRNA(adenine34) deaminase
MEISQRTDIEYMQIALEEAKAAADADEVPIGAVVVKDGNIIARSKNTRERTNNPAGHAEFNAILKAAAAQNAWRLSGCTVYVTLEPCIMCAGLMHQARISRCVYGAPDPKAGALGSLYSIHQDTRLNHTFEVESGVLQDECAQLLKDFFSNKRQQNKQKKKDCCS